MRAESFRGTNLLCINTSRHPCFADSNFHNLHDSHIFHALFYFLLPTQVVYLTFKRLWNLARETCAPVWSLNKVFTWRNSVLKPLQKIWSENVQKRRPHGSSIKMAAFESFECAEPLRMTRVQTFLLEFDESWVILSDQCKNHDFDVLNQSINAQDALIIRRPNIRTSFPMHGSSQALVFREDFRRINCSQSVKMKICCFKEIWQIYATRNICWYRFGY